MNFTEALGGINLNFLVVFDAVMRHKKYSSAAEELNVSVASVSKNIEKLRVVFNDPLFIRSGRVLLSTSKAVELHESFTPLLISIVKQIESARGFDFSTSNRIFNIGGPSFLEEALASELIKLTENIAPNVTFRWHQTPIFGDSTKQRAWSQEVDLFFDVVDAQDKSLNSKLVSESPLFIICRPDHPRIKDTISLDEYNSEQHVVIKNNRHDSIEALESFTSYLHRELGIKRKVRYRTTSSISRLKSIASTDLIGTTPYWAYRDFSDHLRIRYVTPSFTLPSICMYMIWHARYEKDAGCAWLREQLEDCISRSLSNSI